MTAAMAAMLVFIVFALVVAATMLVAMFVFVIVFHFYSPMCSRPWLKIDVTCESARE